MTLTELLYQARYELIEIVKALSYLFVAVYVGKLLIRCGKRYLAILFVGNLIFSIVSVMKCCAYIMRGMNIVIGVPLAKLYYFASVIAAMLIIVGFVDMISRRARHAEVIKGHV